MTQTLVIEDLRRRRLPINLRQSGNSDAHMLISARVRKSPWWHLSKAAGCWAYTTYNHMYHPRAYIKPEDGGLMAEYKYLTEHVSMWDVAVERQIRIKGPDAADFVNMLISRDVHAVVLPMQARYVILCNQYGGVINDPVLLRVADDEFWFSISDSDLLLWAQGVNSSHKFNVDIHEIDGVSGPDPGSQVGIADGKDVRPPHKGDSVLPPDSRHPERPCRNDFAHRFLCGGRVRDLPARRHAQGGRRLALTYWSKGRSSSCVLSPPATSVGWRPESCPTARTWTLRTTHSKSGLAGKWT